MVPANPPTQPTHCSARCRLPFAPSRLKMSHSPSWASPSLLYSLEELIRVVEWAERCWWRGQRYAFKFDSRAVAVCKAGSRAELEMAARLPEREVEPQAFQQPLLPLTGRCRHFATMLLPVLLQCSPDHHFVIRPCC